MVMLRRLLRGLLLNVVLNIILVGTLATGSTELSSLVELLRSTPMTITPATHPHITADTDAAALLGHITRQRSGLCQTRKLLGRIDLEGLRLDIETVEAEFPGLIRILGKRVDGLLWFLEERETQAIVALVANREIREDEISSWSRAVQISHTRHWHTSEDRRGRRGRHSTGLSDGAGLFKRCVQQKVGSVRKGYILLVLAGALEETKFDNGRRINWPTVGVRCNTCQFTIH